MTQTQINEAVEILTKETEEKRLERIFRLVEELREEARNAGIEDMTMEEIDEEIAAYRREKRELLEREAK